MATTRLSWRPDVEAVDSRHFFDGRRMRDGSKPGILKSRVFGSADTKSPGRKFAEDLLCLVYGRRILGIRRKLHKLTFRPGNR